MRTVINQNRLFRDVSKAMISGVCAGVARHFSVNLWVVRGLAILSMLFFPMATALAYVLAILLLRCR
uniref:PspC domain-containing protein n=1 Tax=Ningiella ruwaisensis TaxID=2364274 RepID=UPI0010A08CD3|nr:PspC domain-containing protein [Ningiella ruwaisensis]